ncbi:alpha/beta fold hydrolase [Marinobacter salicampi]|uniref:alpha/beta fold hydrolase n=1 Tax=Marinobacter salicampi TaxID=435907 RepID=UPI00140BDEA5|nr:alpha/beta hydrolase [Marinobacter salicampi]
MNYSEYFLTAIDGHRIPVKRWRPAEARSGLVVAHGMAEHAGRYSALAHYLTQYSIDVFAIEHRGHGSRCPAGELGHYADNGGWQKVITDLHELVGHARSENPSRTLALFGHSMGSFIAQAYAQQHGDRIDSLTLSATNRINHAQLRVSRALVSVIRALKGPRHVSPLIESLTFDAFNKAFRPNRTSHDWLSRDTGQVDAYLADPYCGFGCSVQLWHDFLGGMLAIDPGQWRKDLPVHILSGTADPVGEMGRGVRQHIRVIRSAGVQGSERLFDGGRHELVNEVNAKEVWEHLLKCVPKEPQADEPRNTVGVLES